MCYDDFEIELNADKCILGVLRHICLLVTKVYVYLYKSISKYKTKGNGFL